MKIALGLLAVLTSAVAVVLALPAPIDSFPFEPGPMPELEGRLAPNHVLQACETISVGEIPHPDKLLVDAQGRIYVGDDRGRIHRLTPDGRGSYARELFAEPGGRPMQLAFAPGGELIVANLEGSHLSVDASGRVEELPTLDDVPEGTAGVAVSRDGRLFYGAHTEALPGSAQTGPLLVGLQAHPSSELRVYDPATREVQTLATGLYLPVGVALSSGEDFVAVAEFYAYRVTRYWLKGPRSGSADRLIENLPGFPDGLASDGAGTFYLSFAGLRDPRLDAIHPRPWLKNQVAKLLVALVRLGGAPQPTAGLVVAVDESGRILRSFHDPDGTRVRAITGAEPHGGDLFTVSITGDWVARCPLGGA